MSIDNIDTAVLRGVRNDRRPDALTEKGKDYLRTVLDPYHDFHSPGVGIPSLNSGSTYLRTIRLRQPLLVPALVPGVTAWELHVMTTPVYCEQTAGAISSVLSGTGSAADPYLVKNSSTVDPDARTLSHVCYAWVPTNSALGLMDPLAQFSALPIGSPDWGSYRLVSSGFEVHNSTPELYRSGTVTTWRANNVCEVTNVRMADQNAFGLARVYNGIPATLALANQFPTSRTWEAASGCYVVSSPDFNDVGFKSYDEGTIVIRTGATVGTARLSLACGGLIDVDVGPDASRLVYRSGIVPSGAIFSSIAPESTFTLDCRVLVEVSPDLTSQDLSIASQPSASDPVALELAALAFAQLPSGVPASFNAAGDWFRMVLSTIGSVAPLVAGLVPHAGAKAALTAVGGVSNVAARALDARQRVLPSDSPALRTVAPPPTPTVRVRARAPAPAARRPAPASSGSGTRRRRR